MQILCHFLLDSLVSCFIPKQLFVFFHVQDAAIESLTTVRPYSNEIHAQAQLWLKKDPKASYEAWKKCLPARGKSCKLTAFIHVQILKRTFSAIHNSVYFNDLRSGSCVEASGEGRAATTVSVGEVCVEVEAVHEVQERRRPFPSPAQTEPQQLVATGTQLRLFVASLLRPSFAVIGFLINVFK